MRHPVRFLLIAFIVVLVAAACTAGDDTAMTTGGADGGWETTWAATTTAPALLPGAGEEGEPPAEGSDTDAQGVVATLQPGDFGRSIVYTAGLEIEVNDVVEAGRRAMIDLAGLGGVLFGQETTSGPEPRSVLTIKVPPENFAAALDRLSGLGTLVNQNVFADDVTERVVDLQSRITTAAASVERLRTFLEGATTMKDVADLEAQLLERETDLEVLRGQLRTLDQQVALATIVLTLTEPTPDPALELVATAFAGSDGHCPGSEELALDEGDAFTMCYEVRNTGDTLLGEIEVRDPGLEARFEEMQRVEGDDSVPLAPGGHLIYTFTAKADPGQWISPEVQATALDANGAPLWQQVTLANLQGATLEVAPDNSLPGFVDVLSGAWHGLQRLGGVAVIVGGALLPFIWIPALLVLAWWWLRHRRRPAASPAPASPPAPPEGPSGG
jgi:hypothetical protein